MSKPPLTEQDKQDRAAMARLLKEVAAMKTIASHSQSMAKHASVIQATATNITTLCATFNAGLFFAFATYLATPLGREAIKNAKWQCVFAMSSFTLGFLISCGMLLSILHYSRNKFNYYRNLLNDQPAKDSEIAAGVTFALLFVMITFTLIGVGASVDIILTNYPVVTPANP